MWRLHGDPKYTQAALVDLFTVTEAQSFYACQANELSFVEATSNDMISKLGKGPRAKARKAALKPWPEFVFYTDALLRYASRIDEFGLTGPCHQLLIEVLKRYDFEPALTDPAMIKSWAAQLINYVYWAKQLGVRDYLDTYTKAFNAVYPNEQDEQLDKKQFRNKVYGLTHFVFAASGYYQKPVDAKEFAWILDYFEANIERIIKDGTDDIIAEVGVSFLLAGKEDHPVVSKTRNHIIGSFDEQAQFIPSISGRISYASGEHRNMLAMMLLGWTGELHPGPHLAKLKQTQKYLPKQVKSK